MSPPPPVQFEHAEYEGEQAAAPAAARKSPSLLDAPATYLLLAINILVYAVMLFSSWHAQPGSAPLTNSFDIVTLDRFGGCDGQQILIYHQWWRLLTATFVHGNFLHIAVNMWCLWNLGLLGEPLLGRQGLIATYVLTGIAGNLCSLFLSVLDQQFSMVVGASGAVFGIAGILIVLLSNRKLSLPWDELRALRRSVVQFAVLNLVIGLAPQFVMPMMSGSALSRMPVDLSILTHTDNMAHLGGFASGLAMGAPLFPRMMSGRASYRTRQKVAFVTAALVLALFASGIAALVR